MIGQIISHYAIVGLLDEGGMGVVYKARDVRLGRMVALKFLPRRYADDQSALERFEREARAASALDHRNICTVYDVGEHEGQPFIAMQYLEGQTLKERLATGPLSADEVLHLGIQLADALEVAHSHGIVHRDIKPANIFVTNRSEVKIVDFGVAKILEDDSRGGAGTAPDQSALTQRGTTVGTVAYMSPEQAFADQIDQRADLFSLGVVLYEMAAGTAPFRGPNPAAVLGQIITYSPPSILSINPDLPPELDRIITKAIAKERDARYQSARELRRDLERLRDISSPEIQAVLADSRRTRSTQKRLLIGAAFLAAFVSLLLLALVGLYQSRPTESGRQILRQLTFEPGLQVDPAISPDGTLLAYAAQANGNFDIWVQDLGEDRARRLSSSEANEWQPAWSPNGDKVVFRSEEDGGGLYVVSLQGGPPVKIATFGYQPRWSPDGTRILFFNTPYTPFESREIYLVGLDGQAPSRFGSLFLDRLILVTAGWHSDGLMTVAGQLGTVDRGVWTGDIRTGQFIRNEASAQVLKKASELGLAFWEMTSLVWDPAGRYLYFNGVSNGVTNLWRVGIDQERLRFTGELERLTTGPGIDTNLSLSRDGSRLVFSTIAESLRVWSIPFDPRSRRLTGEPVPISPGGLRAAAPDLAEKGDRLVFAGFRADAPPRLWTCSLAGEEEPASLGALYGRFPRWSRDGTKLAYQSEDRIKVVNVDSLNETVLTASTDADFAPGTWSKDGDWILSSRTISDPRRVEIWKLPMSPGPERQPERVAAHPSKNLWQPRYSPDDRWISFNAVDTLQTGSSRIFIVPAEGGGPWRELTSGPGWNDKARWAPDGKTIYYLSAGGGFLNVWGMPFDPKAGHAAGPPFQLTRFQTPDRFVWQDLGLLELSVSPDRLVLPLMERAGHVWMLENLER